MNPLYYRTRKWHNVYYYCHVSICIHQIHKLHFPRSSLRQQMANNVTWPVSNMIRVCSFTSDDVEPWLMYSFELWPQPELALQIYFTIILIKHHICIHSIKKHKNFFFFLQNYVNINKYYIITMVWCLILTQNGCFK